METEMNTQHTPYEDSIAQAETLLFEAIIAGGTTLNRDGAIESRRDGFVVGGRVPSLKMNATSKDHAEFERNCLQVARWLESQPITLSWSGHVGSWRDGEVVYVDLVDMVDDKLVAVAIGRGRGELAIYDLSTSESIFLDQYRIPYNDLVEVVDDADLQYVD
jgi:hypothetical protein